MIQLTSVSTGCWRFTIFIGGDIVKKLFLASALTALTLSAAQAADAVVYEQTPGASAAYDWSGLYVGAHAGHGWGDGKVQYNGGSNPFSEPNPDGFLGGIYGGYNHQLSSGLVLGVDADITWHSADDWANRGTATLPPSDPDFADSLDIQWSGALRAKVGYAVDRWLPYVAAGVSAAKVELGNRDVGSFTDFGKSTFTGWTIGAGVDYAWSDNLLLRAEYRYTDFGDKNIEHPSFFPSTWDLKTHDVRFGIAYKF